MSDKPSYRQTFLRLVDKCPKSGQLYIETDGGPDSLPMIRGRAFHLFADRAITLMAAEGWEMMELATAKNILAEVLALPDMVIDAADAELLRVAVFHFCEDFLMPDHEVFTETPVQIDLGDVILTGTIDLWWHDPKANVVHMRDWKCGYGLPAQGDVSSTTEGEHRGPKAFQLVVYAALWAATFKHLPVERYDCRFIYPLFAGLPERDVQIHHSDMADHRAWLDSLAGRLRAYEQDGHWPAVPGNHCWTCPAPQRCPIPADLRPVEDLDLYEDGPVAYALKGWALERDLKRVKTTLRAHVEDFGPVRVGDDLEWAIRPVVTRRQTGVGFEGEPLYAEQTSNRFALVKVQS